MSAAKALQAGLQELDRRRGWRGPIDHKDDIDIEREKERSEPANSVVTEANEVLSALVL
jgi:membrane carboxypeptidase/penicillin-binding protein